MDERPKRPPRKKPAAKRSAGKSKAPDTVSGSQPNEVTPAEQAQDEQTPAAEQRQATPAEEQTQASPPPEAEGVAVPVADGESDAAPGPEGETAIVPAADQTAVLPREDETVVLATEQPTIVVPPATPSGYSPLSRTAVVAPPQERRPILWIAVAIVAAALVAVVLMWVAFGGSSAEPFLGTWARPPAQGGGLLVGQDGDGVMVTWYDGQLNAQGPFDATVDGDVLSFQVPSETGGMTGATLKTTDDPNILELTLAGATETVTRVAALSPSTSAPTPAVVPSSSPSPSPSPSASPTTSGSPSPSPGTSGSPSPSPSASGNDQSVINGILAINTLVLNYAAQHGNLFPPTGDVSATGAVGQGQTWPVNPYTGQPMKSGSQPGDYVYEQLQDGQSYKLMGYLANGLTYTVR